MKLEYQKFFINPLILFLMLLATSPSSFSRHISYPTTQDQANTITQPEAEAYKAWYAAFSQGDTSRAISLATRYVKLYPSGKYVAYLRKWIERSLESTRRSEERTQAAEKHGLTILLEETSSVKNKVLESLLNDLIDGQTDPNIRTSGGKTAVMLAAATGDAETVKALIHKGAQVNAREYTHGWTALVYAIWNRDIDTVEALLDNGADVTTRDKDNRTLLEHARISGDADVIRLVERATAK